MNIERIFKTIKNDLTDKKVWLSDEMHKFLEAKIWLICKDFFKKELALKVLYDEDPKSLTACTDGTFIAVNVAHRKYVKQNKGEHLLNVLGALLHELGHYLFTNFAAFEMVISAFENGSFWPSEPKFANPAMELNKAKLKTMLTDDAKRRALIIIARDLENAIEDARIEDMLLRYVKNARFMRKGLLSKREWEYENQKDFSALLDDLANENIHEFEAIICLAFYYAKFRDIKGFEAAHEQTHLFIRFEKLMPLIEKYVEADTGIATYSAFNEVFISLIDDIEKYFDEVDNAMQQQGQQGQGQQNQQQGNGSSGNSSSQGQPQGSQGQGSRSSQGGDSNASNGNDSQQGSSQQQGSTLSEEVVNAIAERLSQLLPEQTTDNSQSMAGNQGSDDMGVQAKINAMKNEESQATPSSNSSSNTVSNGQTKGNSDGKSEFNGQIGGDSDKITTKGTGKREHTTTSEATNLSTEFSRIANAVVGNEAEQEISSQIVDEYEKLAQTSDFGRVHKHADVTFVRVMPNSEDKALYNELLKTQKSGIKEMVRKSDFYEKDRDNVIVKKQLFGTKFNAESTYSPDLKYFSKKLSLEDPPNLAVSLVIDESGSMSGSRGSAAMRMAQMIYEYCEGLNEQNDVRIPLGIYGHTAFHGTSEIYIYADPANPSEDDKYRLMHISSRSCNRDGLAIRIALKRLEDDYPESQKLLIVVTDGKPNDDGYSGQPAEADLHDIAVHCEKEGIGLVVAAIGSDKDNIRRIYGDKHFVDISDLDNLPKAMVRRIKKVLE